MGYGKSQSKLPSDSTGIGSTYKLGWETGIYPPKVEDEDDEEIELPFYDADDLRAFFARVNLGYKSSDSVKQRADMSSYANSNNRFSTVGLGQFAEQNIPTMQGMVSIPGKIKYSGGLGMATGGSSSEFGSTRTGPGKVGGDGTQFGYSRKPLDDEDDDIRFMSLIDLLNFSDDERNFLEKQFLVKQLEVKKTLHMIESLLAK